MADYKDWSEGWLKEGWYISFIRDNIEYYERIVSRDLAHWEYDWHETISSLSTSGPTVPTTLEITKGYEKTTNTNRIWQVIFGIKGQAYIYVELPTDIHRHGIPKDPKPSSDNRETSHFTEYMSPFHEPTFLTEHFMMRPVTYRIALSAYNPNAIALPDVDLNFFISKMITQRIGTIQNGIRTPTSDRFTELLEKLYKQLIPCRPITLEPVRAPAEAPSGE